MLPLSSFFNLVKDAISFIAGMEKGDSVDFFSMLPGKVAKLGPLVWFKSKKGEEDSTTFFSLGAWMKNGFLGSGVGSTVKFSEINCMSLMGDTGDLIRFLRGIPVTGGS